MRHFFYHHRRARRRRTRPRIRQRRACLHRVRRRAASTARRTIGALALALPITLLPRRVAMTTPSRALVAPRRLALRAPLARLRAVATAIALAPVTTRADRHLRVTARTTEHPPMQRHRAIPTARAGRPIAKRRYCVAGYSCFGTGSGRSSGNGLSGRGIPGLRRSRRQLPLYTAQRACVTPTSTPARVRPRRRAATTLARDPPWPPPQRPRLAPLETLDPRSRQAVPALSQTPRQASALCTAPGTADIPRTPAP